VQRPRLDLWFESVFGDDAPSHLGSGWLSGTASVFLGGLALGAVGVLWFPEWLSTAQFRPLYPVAKLRLLIQALIAAGFVAGVLSMLLRRRKVLGATGVALAIAASLLGGGGVAVDRPLDRPFTLGLDWFLLNLFVLALLFVPLERLFPKWPEQGPFRNGWTTDTLHFLSSHALVQAMSFLILLPATTLAGIWQPEGFQAAVRSQPLALQLIEVVVLADLAQYAVHRAFHRVPLLWRFHAVHHSSVAMDWLAGSRLHLVDALATRSLVLVPLFLLGFAQRALEGYLLFVSFHAVFIHANVRFGLRPLEPLLVTPRFHHWHHAAADAARDKNFAVHLPWLDRLFGSHYMPEQPGWPDRYGISGDPVPPGYAGQLVYPFR
jgi:sterol desaturase/sphingolipid hydroxylase (fatty acid hydroxylase superfamily)